MSGELPPIRCVTCNKILADKWNKYNEMIENGNSIENTLNYLGLTRPCCRLRLRNPFKYVEKMDTADEESLYVSEPPKANTQAALVAIKIPEHEEIELPPIPILPPISVEQKKNTRVYQAW